MTEHARTHADEHKQVRIVTTHVKEYPLQKNSLKSQQTVNHSPQKPTQNNKTQQSLGKVNTLISRVMTT